MFAFITSSPFVDGADRPIFSNENSFVDRIREVLPPFPRCLFISSDPGRHDLTCRFGMDVLMAFAEAGFVCSAYTVLDGENAQDAEALVSMSDLIVLSGGHVPTQNAFFREIGLREVLKGFEGVVLGISAGSMNAADIVYVQPEDPGESDPDFERFALGLGITGVNILPHYQKVRDNILDGLRLYEDITYADSMGHEFFALPDGSYFYQDDGQLLLCGKAYRLKDGIFELLTLDGEVLDMAQLD